MSPAVRIGVVLAILLAVLAAIVLVALDNSPLPDAAPETGRAAERTAEPAPPPPREPSRRRRSTDTPAETEPDDPPATEDAPTERGPLTIHVVGKDGKPIGGARVVAEDAESVSHEAVTGADGTAKFHPPIDSDYARIVVSAEGHAAARHFADKQRMRDGGTVEIELADGVAIEGVVLEKDTGFTIAGATVSALGAETTTGANGTFRLDSVPAGSGRTLRVTERRHVTVTPRIDDAPGRPIEVRMERSGFVRGVVTLHDGTPAAWATVLAKGADGQSPAWALRFTANTDERGVYEVGGLPMRGRWVVVASKPGLGDSVDSEPFEFDATRPEAVRDLSLRASMSFEVRVLRPDGAPAAGAKAELRTSTIVTSLLPCDENGVRRFETFDGRRCRVRAEAPGFPAREMVVEPTPGRVTTVEIRLEIGVAIGGVVVDDTGAPVANADVSARQEGASSWPSGRTGSDGRFRVEGLAPGVCTLVAGAARHAPGRPTSATVPDADARLVLTRSGRIKLYFANGNAAREKPFTVRLVAKDGRHDERVVAAVINSAEVPCDPGEWKMVLEAPGFAPLLREFTVLPGRSVDLPEIAPDAGSTLAGLVVDVNGAPVAGVRIELSARPVWMLLGQTVTDATGAFSMEHVPAGSARLDVMHVDYLAFGKEFALGANAGRLDVTLRKAGILAGTLRESGELVPLGRIRATLAGDDEEPVLTTTGTDGTFLMKLRPGRWRLAIPRKSGDDVTYDVEVKDGATTTVDLTR